MKKLILTALLLSVASASFASTAVKRDARRDVVSYSLADSQAIRLTASAQSNLIQDASVDIFIACTTTADCYWDVIGISGNTATASASFSGVTLSASTGWILVEDVNPYWGIVNWGGAMIIRLFEGSR